MNLKCKEVRCEYNKNLACLAGEIQVKKDTVCNTFLPHKETSEKNYKKRIFKEENETDIMPHERSVGVECQAKCIFNHKKLCHANGITIMQDQPQPLCQTFLQE